MGIATVRNHCTSLPGWVRAGEELVITRRGKPVARLVPESQKEPGNVNPADRPAVTRDRSGGKIPIARESLVLIHDAASKW